MIQPLVDFLRLEAAGGLVLMASAVLALVVANSPLAVYYAALLDVPLSVSVGSLGIAKPLLLWINDGLMAVFFFLVGMELKREVLEGHLSSVRQATLPAFAAVGGMLLPASLYAAFNWNDAVAMNGWAIPTATDIAFALGVLSLLGNRVPTALKALLLSVAIFDDLGAIIVIALFYTAQLSTLSLAVAGGLTLALAVLNRAGVTRPAAYILIGIPLWVAVLKSGVHATLAGVVIAMFVPLRVPGEAASPSSQSPLRELEHTLHPWVAFGILPVFAFANAGVSLAGLSLRDTLHPVPLGIVAALFVGKQVGVMALCWIAIRLRIASLPAGVGWWQLYGTALLCGIGFTMSLFIASLAFEPGSASYLGLERLGILIGSLLCGLAGYAVLRFASVRGEKAT
ncbi:MAG: Na+/H+ antiporter NhaA [Gemmatimonadaceae bacterium]